MTRLRQYINAPKRYKNSHGFGVHSPFAFYFIRRVLCERTPYYAYADIEQLRQQAHRQVSHIQGHSRVISAKHAKMLFRLLCYFKPDEVLQIGSTYGVSTRTALLYDTRLRVTLYGAVADAAATDDSRVSVIDNLDPLLHRGKCFPMVLVSDIRPEDRAKVTTLLRQHLEAGSVVVVRNLSRDSNLRVVWSSVCRSMEHGMSFTNGKIGVIVGKEHLPLQQFELWF